VFRASDRFGPVGAAGVLTVGAVGTGVAGAAVGEADRDGVGTAETVGPGLDTGLGVAVTPAPADEAGASGPPAEGAPLRAVRTATTTPATSRPLSTSAASSPSTTGQARRRPRAGGHGSWGSDTRRA
jgi:hypothetical protein